ncbi:helix-turn-helix domain-containing protein [Lacticaseibacillus saniviri]
MTLVERIKEIAKKRGWNLKTTALKAGLSENTIYGWKKFSPASDKLQAVADVLNVSVDYLLGKTSDPMPAQSSGSKPKKLDLKEQIDDESVIMTFEGRPIPKEDLEIIKRLLRRD